MAKRLDMTWYEFTFFIALIVLPATAIAVILLAYYLPRARDTYTQSACANNLRQLGAAFRIYARNNKDFYPPLTRRYRTAPEAGEAPWMFLPDEQVLFPNYITDPALFLCPATSSTRRVLRKGGAWVNANGRFDPAMMDDRSYVYTGYASALDFDAINVYPYRYFTFASLPDEMAFIVEKAIRPAMEGGIPINARFARAEQWTMPEELVAPSEINGEALTQKRYALQDGIERYFVRDNPGPGSKVTAQSDIPILWDRPQPNATNPFAHGAGGNVLYMDGHVEFVPYPSKIPMTPAFVNSAALTP